MFENYQNDKLDRGTAVLIENILRRRNARLNSKPQTANPVLPNIQDNYDRPGTTSYVPVSYSPTEDHFPPPKELQGTDYPVI